MHKPKLKIQSYIWISGIIAATILLIVIFQIQSPSGNTPVSTDDVTEAIDNQGDDVPDLSDVTRVLDELDAAVNLLSNSP